MLPLPSSKVFRSRKGAIWWSLWVLVAAVMTVGFGDSAVADAAAAATEVFGAPVDDADLKSLIAVINAS